MLSAAVTPLAVMVPGGHELVTAIVTGLMLGGLFAVTALGLSLVFGVMRLINLAHGELVIVGGYLALELTRRADLDPLVTIAVLMPVVFLVAIPIQYMLLTPLMGRDEAQPLLTTFGLSVIGQNLFILIFGADTAALASSYASESFTLAGVRIPAMYAISFAAALVLCGGTQLLVQMTGFGREVRAAAEDARAAAVLGVNVKRVYAILFGLAAACAAVGGVLVGLTFSFSPTSGTTYLLTGFAVVVLGGLGSVKGTLLGGLLLGVIEELGASFFGDGYRDLIGFVAFLVVLGLRPQGLFGRKA